MDRMRAGVKFSEDRCYEILRQMRWPKGIICPLCEGKRVTTHSKFTSTSRRRYLCVGCRRTFTDLTGTPLARTNLPLGTWFLCLDLTARGQKTSELAKELGVKWDTAAYMVRRLDRALIRQGFVWRLRDAVKEAQYE
ncbi:MAG: transposase [Deltaproteobacteria bacterium]|nr:transposase [Deltaproteobacteria bacterium]